MRALRAPGRYGKHRAHLSTAEARRCRKKFLRFFPDGFRDEKYRAWERGYKEAAHLRWEEALNRRAFQALIHAGRYAEVAATAVRIESRTNLLFSFEKMALRDAVKSKEGAKLFALGLFDFLFGRGDGADRFEHWCETISKLPRRQTRVLTWPIATVFGFLAQPDIHLFLKPTVTRRAGEEYAFPFAYQSKPQFATYQSLLEFASVVRSDLSDLSPVDMIDIQSFLWVQGSDEYAE